MIGPDGKPVVGAKVFAVKRDRSGAGSDRVEVATSAADGTFRVARPADDFTSVVLVHKDGFGVAWHDLSEGPAPQVWEFKLGADLAITGRIIDTEGKPVAGVRVVPEQITAPVRDTLDAVLDAMKAGTYRTRPEFERAATRTNWVGGVGSATTDADGKFTLSGCGAERLVQLTVSGDGWAHKSLTVVTRAKFDPSAINAVGRSQRSPYSDDPDQRLNGPNVRVIVERGKVVEGVVRDTVTKKPIAGAIVSTHQSTKTAADGRFKLGGFPKATKYSLYVSRPPDGAYLSRNVVADDTEGYTPAKCEIELRLGVVVTGRVTDKGTGKPVSSVVQILPLAGNTFLAEYFPGTQFAERTAHHTDKDGRFRIVTVPGKLLVIVQGHEPVLDGQWGLMPFRGVGPDPEHPEDFDTKRQPGYAYYRLADSSLSVLSNADHGVRVLEVARDAKPVTADFALDRGVTGRIRIEGPDGKPAPGTTVIGLAHAVMPAKLTEATAPVFALDPKAAPREIVVWDAEKKIGGTATLRGDEREPVTVKLQPLTDIKGTFVTADGKPVGGANIQITTHPRIDPSEDREGVRGFLAIQFGVGEGSRVTTAADGTFAFSGVLPGVEYHLRMAKGDVGFPARGAKKMMSAKPEVGKVLDLGTIDVGVLREE